MKSYSKSKLTAALCGAFLFSAGAQAWAGPMSIAVPQAEEGLAPLVAQAKHYPAPAGKKCLKWTRRWHSSLGMGHKRCVHWE